jgi:hypothetical protein
MKIDLTTILTDENDKPLYAYKTLLLADKETKQPIKDGDKYLQYTFEDKADEITLGRMVRQCLLNDWEGIAEGDKLDKFTLLLDLNKATEFEFTTRHTELIKKSISKQPTWIYGLIHSLLQIK